MRGVATEMRRNLVGSKCYDSTKQVILARYLRSKQKFSFVSLQASGRSNRDAYPNAGGVPAPLPASTNPTVGHRSIGARVVVVNARGDGLVQPRVGRQAGGHRGGPCYNTPRAPLGGTRLRALPAVCPVVDGVRIEGHRRCLLYTSPSPRDQRGSRMPSSA